MDNGEADATNKWLAMARRWHLFFAWLLVINGVCYALYALASRHLQRDLLPTCVFR